MVCTRSLTDAVTTIKSEFGDIFDLKIIFIKDLSQNKMSPEAFRKILEATAILLIDIRGNSPEVEILVEYYHDLQLHAPEKYKEKNIISLVGGNAELRALTKLGSFEAKKIPTKAGGELGFDEIPDLSDLVQKGIKISQNMAKISKVLPIGIMRHMRNWFLAMDYWVYGYSGIPENHTNMLRFLLKEYLNVKFKEISPPLKIPVQGIYHPLYNKYFESLAAYTEQYPLDQAKQTIGIFYYGGIYFEQSLPIVREFTENLHEFNIIPVYSEVTTNLQTLNNFFFIKDRCIASIIINLQYFQLNGGPFGGNNLPTMDLYRKMNIPQINPVINFDLNVEEYEQSKQGISPINQIIAVIMPELDGRIEMMTVGCMEHLGDSEAIASGVYDIIPLKENIKVVANRVRSWLRLRKKTNGEKRIALILYDYPPGEATLGNASYLDVNSSLRQILQYLEKEGYYLGTNFKIESLQEIVTLLLESGMVNNPKNIGYQKFRGVLLDKSDYDRLIQNVPNEILSKIDKTWGTFPGHVMVQNMKIKLPILQLGNIFIGIQPPRAPFLDNATEYHNQELPPHHQYLAFYRYLEEVLHIDAVVHVGTHGTLEFLPGKENVGNWKDSNLFLLGNLPNIYIYHVSNTSEAAIAKRRSNAVIVNHSPPPMRISETYERYEELELLLLDYTNIIHNKTESNSNEIHLNAIIAQIRTIASELNISETSIENIESRLYRLKLATIPNGLHVLGQPYSKDQLLDFIVDLILHSPAIPIEIQPIFDPLIQVSPPKISAIRELIEPYVNAIFTESKLGYSSSMSITSSQFDFLSGWLNTLISNITENRELINLIQGLEGGFISPGIGGDPIRTPDVFPTGRNSYGFDPRLIPSSIATKRGKKIALRLLQEHFQQTGNYPETVSVVLWAFETMKSGGETIGQIFEYLGVRAVKHKSVWTTELEIIPIADLGHPRINVVVTICGIFRDTFPYLMDLINHAIERVAQLDEPHEQNFIRKTSFDLERQGCDLPSARMFGPAPGKYNTNLTDLINQGSWKNEKELVNDYIVNMGNIYLPNSQIKAAIPTFRSNLQRIVFTSQVRDGSEYQITDLDHYYEFSGGLQRAVEEIKGSPISVFIADTSSVDITVEPIENAIQEGVITRNLNPKWLDGMLKHKFHGTQKVAERVENLLGISATTHRVENWVWEKTYIRYIEDEKYKTLLTENNRFAMMKMIKTMLEAQQRGYWSTDEKHLQNLKRLYLELEGWTETQFG